MSGMFFKVRMGLSLKVIVILGCHDDIMLSVSTFLEWPRYSIVC